MNREEQRLARRVREHLERDAGRADELLSARLRAMRLRALERVPSGPPWPERLIPAGTLAAALVVALFFSMQGGAPPAGGLGAADLIADSRDLELIEDLEFYQWLERRGNAG